jgi:hypothetical protein
MKPSLVTTHILWLLPYNLTSITFSWPGRGHLKKVDFTVSNYQMQLLTLKCVLMIEDLHCPWTPAPGLMNTLA